MSLKIEHHDSRRIVYSDLKINENPKLREILISEKLQELIGEARLLAFLDQLTR